MAVVNWQDIGDLQTADADSIRRALVVPAKEALRQTRFALTGNLTIRDNAYAAIVTLGQLGNNTTQTLTHGIEYVLQNPLKTTPVGFTPIKAFDANGVAIAIPQCTLNTSRTDGFLGITPQFAPPFGECVAKRTTAWGSAVPDITVTYVPLETTELMRGAIGWVAGTPTRLTFSAAGQISLGGQLPFNTTAAGGYREALIYKNRVAASPVADAIEAGGAQFSYLNVSEETSVVAGDYIELAAFQSSGGPLALTGARVSLRARYVAPPVGYSANVTGVLWGG